MRSYKNTQIPLRKPWLTCIFSSSWLTTRVCVSAPRHTVNERRDGYLRGHTKHNSIHNLKGLHPWFSRRCNAGGSQAPLKISSNPRHPTHNMPHTWLDPILTETPQWTYFLYYLPTSLLLLPFSQYTRPALPFGNIQ